MMKTKVKVVLLVLVCLMLIGCGTNKKKESKTTLGLVPSRIENIQNGGTIPEGCQAKVICDSGFKTEMFWGTWVLDSSQPEEFKESFVLGSNENAKEFCCFPNKMRFNPVWAGMSLDAGFWQQDIKQKKDLTMRRGT